jgi:hypothetical protein
MQRKVVGGSCCLLSTTACCLLLSTVCYCPLSATLYLLSATNVCSLPLLSTVCRGPLVYCPLPSHREIPVSYLHLYSHPCSVLSRIISFTTALRT